MAFEKGGVVAITGGATGIGFALAKRLGADGSKIVIGEPRQAKLDTAVAELQALGVEAAAAPLDVTDAESVDAFADFAWDRFGPVGLLVNNAGVGRPMKGLLKTPVEDVQALFDVNVFGVWRAAAAFGKRMVEAGRPAAIYNVGSENSFFPAAPKIASYVASKHAVRGLTLAMAEEFPDFMKVGLICPGFVKSDMTPPPFGDLGMDTDAFADKVVTQINAGADLIVTHAHNIDRIKPLHDAVEAAYATHAPRYHGDEEYDVRTLLANLSDTE